jgi:hypothetical protein
MRIPVLLLIGLIALTLIGCSAMSRPNTDADDCKIKSGHQLQKSSSLSAGRYTMLLDTLEKGNVDDARNDIDYWLDMAIVELQYLEETFPTEDWAGTPIQGLEEIKMKKIYGDIARYRLAHPHKYKVPLDDNFKRLIDTFIEKYK